MKFRMAEACVGGGGAAAHDGGGGSGGLAPRQAGLVEGKGVGQTGTCSAS